MIHRIANKHDVTYYAALFKEGLLEHLPWGNEVFDCLIFPSPAKSRLRMESLLNSLPYDRVDWVFTAEPDSEYWHDRIDQKAVEKGCQEKVGDGHPMTAAFKKISAPCDWRASCNLGQNDHFLFIFLDRSESIATRVKTLARKIKGG